MKIHMKREHPVETCYSGPTLFRRAAFCNTAVRKPVGKVNPDSQKSTGGWVLSAHLENCSTLWTRSLVHDPRGFMEG